MMTGLLLVYSTLLFELERNLFADNKFWPYVEVAVCNSTVVASRNQTRADVTT
jgi:hypothetical protein